MYVCMYKNSDTQGFFGNEDMLRIRPDHIQEEQLPHTNITKTTLNGHVYWGTISSLTLNQHLLNPSAPSWAPSGEQKHLEKGKMIQVGKKNQTLDPRKPYNSPGHSNNVTCQGVSQNHKKWQQYKG